MNNGKKPLIKLIKFRIGNQQAITIKVIREEIVVRIKLGIISRTWIMRLGLLSLREVGLSLGMV